ncbi:MAG: hypothetical protein AB7G93_09345 [Bdellovibrionales bacterium]
MDIWGLGPLPVAVLRGEWALETAFVLDGERAHRFLLLFLLAVVLVLVS